MVLTEQTGGTCDSRWFRRPVVDVQNLVEVHNTTVEDRLSTDEGSSYIFYHVLTVCQVWGNSWPLPLYTSNMNFF